MHIQPTKCLILSNCFPTGSKYLIFCNCVIFDMNIIPEKNGANMCFSFGYIDICYLRWYHFSISNDSHTFEASMLKIGQDT